MKLVTAGELDKIFMLYLENHWKDPVAFQDQWLVICFLNRSELQFCSCILEFELFQIPKAMFEKDNSISPPEDKFADYVLQIRLKWEKNHPKG